MVCVCLLVAGVCVLALGGRGLRVWVRAYVFACSYVCGRLYVR